MVFPSIPVYLNSPNCQQQPKQHREANGSDSPQLLPPLPPRAQTLQVDSIKPGSTVDQAQVAKISPPKAVLKCPRCESTNTKFCYFNNYSLSQPRHFCKTCRRYWTRGGALRNIPVGGGCRRNKKNKRSHSKSPAPTEKQSLLPNSTSAVAVPSGATYHELIGRFTPQPSSNRAVMASLHNMSSYGAVGNMRQTEHIRFQIGGGGVEQWQLQQFPSLSAFESANNSLVSSSSFPFQSDHQSVEAASAGLVGLGDIGAISRVTQMPPVKLKGNRGLNLTRSTSFSENNKFYSWTDLSDLVSSSASHLL